LCVIVALYLLSRVKDHCSRISQVVDNVVRSGRVSDPNYSDPSIEGVRDLLKMLKDDKDVEATTIGTVGEKGYDGFIYAVRK